MPVVLGTGLMNWIARIEALKPGIWAWSHAKPAVRLAVRHVILGLRDEILPWTALGSESGWHRMLEF